MSDLPKDRFVVTDIENVGDSAATTAGIMELALPVGVRVAMTILKKLYLQRGSGRMENAFSRGLDPSSRRLVEPVLREIERTGLSTRGRVGSETIWFPVRSAGARVKTILSSPSADDALLDACRQL